MICPSPSPSEQIAMIDTAVHCCTCIFKTSQPLSSRWKQTSFVVVSSRLNTRCSHLLDREDITREGRLKISDEQHTKATATLVFRSQQCPRELLRNKRTPVPRCPRNSSQERKSEIGSFYVILFGGNISSCSGHVNGSQL